MLNCFYLIPERYGQTDRQTDGQNCYVSMIICTRLYQHGLHWPDVRHSLFRRFYCVQQVPYVAGCSSRLPTRTARRRFQVAFPRVIAKLLLITLVWLTVWLSGNALVSINVLTLRQARLVPGWVTVFGRVNYLGM